MSPANRRYLEAGAEHGERGQSLARVTSARGELGTGAPSIHRIHPEKGRLRTVTTASSGADATRLPPLTAMTCARWRQTRHRGHCAIPVAVADPLLRSGGGPGSGEPDDGPT